MKLIGRQNKNTISFLGQNFVVFRTEGGEVHIFDAYCPHLGANLGVGGIVKGDCIECPFHQWSFRASDGECTNIPYSTSGSGKCICLENVKSNGFIILNQKMFSSKIVKT